MKEQKATVDAMAKKLSEACNNVGGNDYSTCIFDNGCIFEDGTAEPECCPCSKSVVTPEMWKTALDN